MPTIRDFNLHHPQCPPLCVFLCNTLRPEVYTSGNVIFGTKAYDQSGRFIPNGVPVFYKIEPTGDTLNEITFNTTHPELRTGERFFTNTRYPNTWDGMPNMRIGVQAYSVWGEELPDLVPVLEMVGP